MMPNHISEQSRFAMRNPVRPEPLVGGASDKSAFIRHAEKCWTCNHSPHGPCDAGWKIINAANNSGTGATTAGRNVP